MQGWNHKRVLSNWQNISIPYFLKEPGDLEYWKMFYSHANDALRDSAFLSNAMQLYWASSVCHTPHPFTLFAFFHRLLMDTEKLLLIEQCPGPSSRCDHTPWFQRLKLRRAGDSFHSKCKFSWGWSRTADHRINAQESYHWATFKP